MKVVAGQTTALDRIKSALSGRLKSASLELPPLPTVAREVVATTHSETADAAKLSELIHRDQALAGHVMRIANSPLYMSKVPIVSLQQAVGRLGFRTLGEIAFTASVGGRVFRVPGFEPVLGFLWKHALTSGTYAKEIARIRRRSVESAFLCGMLHAVGKPVLLRTIADIAAEMKISVSVADARTLVDGYYTRVGVIVAKEWKLPEVVVHAIAHHGDPANAPSHTDEVATTCLAERLAKWLLMPNAFPQDTVREHPVFELLNLYPHDVDDLLERGETIRGFAEALQ